MTDKSPEIRVNLPAIMGKVSEKVIYKMNDLVRLHQVDPVLPRQKDLDDRGKRKKSLPRTVQAMKVHRLEDRSMSLLDEDTDEAIVPSN